MPYYRHVVSGLTPVNTRWSTTLHSSTSATLPTVQTAWVNFCNTFIGTTLVPMWNTHTTADIARSYLLDPTTGKASTVTQTALTQVGTGTGGSVSSRDCFVVTTRTANAGKTARGRMFWPSPDDSHYQTTGQLVKADATTLANGFASAYGTFKLTSIGVVWHKALKIGDAIVEIDIDINVRSQNRRTDKAASNRSAASV